MASQPANTSIQVYLRLKGVRKSLRHESVAALTKKLRPLVLSVPGEEVLVGVLARDTTMSDFSPYMGEARVGASRGMPIVVGTLPEVTFADAQETLANVDFAITIGADKFIQSAEASLATNDLFAGAQAL